MKYIILLRGINISGKNKISMHVLKSTLEDNGYNNVITYLNSGNVILDSDKPNKDAIAQNIFEIIKEKFGFEIEGRLRNQTRVDGVYYDLYVMGLML